MPLTDEDIGLAVGRILRNPKANARWCGRQADTRRIQAGRLVGDLEMTRPPGISKEIRDRCHQTADSWRDSGEPATALFRALGESLQGS